MLSAFAAAFASGGGNMYSYFYDAQSNILGYVQMNATPFAAPVNGSMALNASPTVTGPAIAIGNATRLRICGAVYNDEYISATIGETNADVLMTDSWLFAGGTVTLTSLALSIRDDFSS